jgi:ADP-ribosylglycohydrolase
MRILPASIYFACLPDPMAAGAVSQFSAITHGHPRSRFACVFFSLMASELLKGADPAAALRNTRVRIADLKEYSPEIGHFHSILQQDLASTPEEAIRSGGYVVDTLTAAVWCLLGTGSYRDCVLRAVNLGEDTDTTGEVAGALAGLRYGRSGIPAEWTGVLARAEEIRDRTELLGRLCTVAPPFPDSYWILPGKLVAGEYPGAKKPEEALRGSWSGFSMRASTSSSI